MKLLLTGTIPIWALLLLFLFCAGLSVYLYRLHRLPDPWSKWLPICRVAALLLLVLTLLQPVIAVEQNKTLEGRIPVVIDTSGSMSIKDKFELPEQVDVTWHMLFFDQDLRSIVFRETAESVPALSEEVAATRVAEEELRNIIRQSDEWSKIKPMHKALVSQLEDVEDLLEDAREDLSDTIEDHEYLQDEDEEEAEEEPEETEGRIVMERYDNIGGSSVADLLKNKKFPDMPDKVIYLKTLDIPRDSADNYGLRIRGYLTPPRDGEYTIMVAADDQCTVFLSNDEKPEGKKEICKVNSATGVHQWTRDKKNQKSKKIRLEAGKHYYFELLHKEGSSKDHMTVGWQWPDKRFEKAIPDEYLLPFGTDLSLLLEDEEKGTLKFLEEYAELAKTLEALQDGVTVCLEGLDTIDKKTEAKERGPILKTSMEALADLDKELAALPERLTTIQRAADERLALAEIEEVDEALERFKEMTRADIVKQLLYEKPYRLIDSLRDKGKVNLFTFGEEIKPLDDEQITEEVEYNQASTRIGSVVTNILNFYEKQPLAAMVVLSDGNINAGKPTADAHEVAEDNGVPLITIGVGSELPPDDIAIDHIIAPSTTFRDDLLNLNVVLKRDGYSKRPVKLVVKNEDKVVHEKVIEPGPETRLVVDMGFEEEEGGHRHYTVEAETLDGEVLDDNNSKTFSVNVLEDPIQTLLLDEFPRWESRYANMMLERDKRITVRPIFIGSQEDGVLPVKEDKYPMTRDELFAFHIVVLGDVNPSHFSEQQLKDLRDFVTERGGTIMLMAGEHYMPQAYEATPLAEIFPFRIDNTMAGRPADDEKVWSMDLTDSGRFAEILQVARTPEETEKLWKELPGLNWVKQGIRPTSSAEYLVTSSDNQPVMLSSYAGQGKMLYLGGDSFWRWRYRARWTYHHRFWGQVLLWATLGRTTGNDQFVKMQTNRLEYSPGEPVIVKARILDEKEKVMEDASAYVDIFDEEEKLVTTLPLIPIKNSGGEYRTTVKDLKRGKYKAIPRVSEFAERKFEGDVSFNVKDLPTSEYVDLTLNDTVLKQMGAEYHPFHLANALLEGVENADETVTTRKEYEIWDTVYLMMMVAVLLGIEWQIRKRSRLL
jgi:hypothetical protein